MPPASHHHAHPPPFLPAFVLVLTCFLAGLAGTYLCLARIDLDARCAQHTSAYSPLLRDVKAQFEMRQFNGSFLRETIYRQDGSSEVDAAWGALGINYRPAVISAAQGIRSGLSPSHVRRTDKYGGGFIVNVEGLHHLHCLDLLRKGLYYNYPHYKAEHKMAFGNVEPILKLHMTHCLDTLRQVLQCRVDTGVLGQVWVRDSTTGLPVAFPDFNTAHVCRKYDDVRAWAEENQVMAQNQVPADYLVKPDPADILPFTP